MLPAESNAALTPSRKTHQHLYFKSIVLVMWKVRQGDDTTDAKIIHLLFLHSSNTRLPGNPWAPVSHILTLM